MSSTELMTDAPSHGVTCAGRCGTVFDNGDQYVPLLTAGTLVHPLTGEVTACYLMFCTDCAQEVEA